MKHPQLNLSGKMAWIRQMIGPVPKAATLRPLPKINTTHKHPPFGKGGQRGDGAEMNRFFPSLGNHRVFGCLRKDGYLWLPVLVEVGEPRIRDVAQRPPPYCDRIVTTFSASVDS